MSKNIIADSGFWFALFNARDQYHTEAKALESELEFHTLLVPWPTLYEAINTRFTRKSHQVHQLKKFLELPSTRLIDDLSYRDELLKLIFSVEKNTCSLVDHVIRAMLSDPSISVDAFIGFNPKDFFDVCARRDIKMLFP